MEKMDNLEEILDDIRIPIPSPLNLEELDNLEDPLLTPALELSMRSMSLPGMTSWGTSPWSPHVPAQNVPGEEKQGNATRVAGNFIEGTQQRCEAEAARAKSVDDWFRSDSKNREATQSEVPSTISDGSEFGRRFGESSEAVPSSESDDVISLTLSKEERRKEARARRRRKNPLSLRDRRALESVLYPPEEIGDLKGTTASRVKNMTAEERDVVLYKRKLRNRESAKRSREKRKQNRSTKSE